MSVEEELPNRCRLILVVTPMEEGADNQLGHLEDALKGGDVASVLFSPGHYARDDKAGSIHFTEWCKKLVPIAVAHDAAAIVVGDTQAMGRSGADGLLVDFGQVDAGETVARFSPQKQAGLYNLRDRHRALEAGELQPDFVFFGKPEGDIKPDAHPKNLALGEWWSQMVEIPCVVMGGSDLSSAVEVAKSGADFVALGLAVFTHLDGAGAAVRQVNDMLDAEAPVFEIEE